ncbi:flagellar hook-length control protein FliK [Hydrogenimonas thermophila]|uniref:Hook-length control protein FliK n=1 Tax=Hydrogenimonas thermophila TaxID=223786 RepID=A0A1I5LHE6_9BACT|nr:flagellar hook-length control protein FliK [Hydrogenimonas thermophila]SFO96246.1 hook-length control protein FliK [Hydrogenimonas thermophila]
MVTQTLEAIQNSNLSKNSDKVKSAKDESNESSFEKILLSIKDNNENDDTELLNKLTKLQETDNQDSKNSDKFNILKKLSSEETDTLAETSDIENESIELLNKKIADTKNNNETFVKNLSSKNINTLTETIENLDIENKPINNIEKVIFENRELQNEKTNLPTSKNQSNSKTPLENENFLSNISNTIKTNNELNIEQINSPSNDDNTDRQDDKEKNKESSISNLKLSTLLNNNFESNENKIEKSNLENKEKELKYQNYTSRTFLSKTENIVKNEHEIKQSKTLNEIINTAKKHNLNPQKIEIETKKQDKSTNKQNLQSQTSITSAKAILNSHPHISQHVAALNLEVDESKKNLDKKTSISLQELLQKSNTDKTENISQNSVTKSSNTEQENSLAKMLSQLQQNSSKPNSKENIFTSKLKEIEKKSITNTKTEKTFTKVDLNEMVHNDSINKSSEQISQRIIDAKQTVRHFAQTLQEQVENYKPPFTRMQLSLDPKDLGKVEVTLISRGNNLHIQVNSNPTAIGVMAIQGNELRNQLTSMGFTDVQMQFNMNQQQQQQQQQNNRRQMYSSNEYIDIDEIPENYESLEIIIPQYV